MKLQTKTIGSVIVAFCGLSIIIYLVLSHLLNSQFLQLETKQYQENMVRVANAFEKDQQLLYTVIEDYAVWDETYNFMGGQNNSYLSEEWADAVLAHYRMNAIVFIDPEGKIIAAKSVDFDLKKEIPFSQDYIDTITKNKQLWAGNQGGNPGKVTGIIISDTAPLMMVSHQIVDNNNEKPYRGYVIAFRLLDDQYIADLSQTVQLPLAIGNIMTTDDSIILQLIEAKDSIMIRWVDEEYGVGEYLVKTVEGHPAFIITAMQRRDIHEAGVNVIYYLIKNIFGASVFFTFLLIFFLRRVILRRLSDLIFSLQQIADKQDLSVRLRVSESDEITDVTRTINKMLGALQESKELSKQIMEELDASIDEVSASNAALNELTATLELRVTEKTLQLEKQIDIEVALNNAASSFIPYGFLKALGKNDIREIKPGDHVEKKITVLFIDIRSYTTISESMTNKEVFDFINFYLAIGVKIISKNNGFIDKFIGDAIMALFPNSVDDALCAVIELNEALKDYNSQRDRVSIKTGAGIHYGAVMLGTVGTQQRMDTTVLGDSVNVAARLEAATKTYGMNLLISENVYLEIENRDKFAIREIDIVKVKGKKMPTKIYEVFDSDDEELKVLKSEISLRVAHGIALYREGKFKEADLIFKECKEICPDDELLALYIKRCDTLIKIPPSVDWAGISSL